MNRISDDVPPAHGAVARFMLAALLQIVALLGVGSAWAAPADPSGDPPAFGAELPTPSSAASATPSSSDCLMTGQWKSTAKYQGGPAGCAQNPTETCTFNLVQNGSNFSGTGFCSLGGNAIVSGTVNGNFVNASSYFSLLDVTSDFGGTLSGNTATGNWVNDYGCYGTATFTKVSSGCTPSPSPSISPSATPSPSRTPSASPTPSPTPSMSPTPTPFNGATLVRQSLPKKMTPGQTLLVGFTFRNTGNTIWTGDGAYSLGISGLFGPSRLPLLAPVEPGQDCVFIGALTAPLPAGPYAIRVQMVQEYVEWFGDSLAATISVEIPPNAAEGWVEYE